jgi:hypothetical protein
MDTGTSPDDKILVLENRQKHDITAQLPIELAIYAQPLWGYIWYV